MKKEMSLSEIQRESISILSRIDDFFMKHGIEYSLGYGSLIGAIRHKGCIPWDDDIDIIITRPNYQKLIALHSILFDETGLSLYSPELGNCYVKICRITDNSKTVVDKYYQWTDEQTGLWIDVFVIDGVPSIDTYNKFRAKSIDSYMACKSRLRLFRRERLIDNLKRVVHSIQDCKWWFVNRKALIEEYLKEFIIDYDSCSKVGCYDSPYGEKDIFSKDVFSSYLRIPFQNISVSVIANYDTYLRSLYGDYLTPPPIEKQKRSHTSNHYYFK